MFVRGLLRGLAALSLLFGAAVGAAAQQPGDQHDHQDMPMNMDHMNMNMSTWTFMQDGVVNAVFNHQGGPRGDDEAATTNWWMGMTSRAFGRKSLTLTGMFSLEPAAGKDGYAEIFQQGEVLDGKPLVDRQHPHDLFMQLSAAWRAPIGTDTTFTIAGGPVGEPALGPIAFMHRASAAAIPFAPLSHHTFDSTHIAFGVVTGAVNHKRWTAEFSVFNGREPDDNRWDFDFGKLDSVSGRVWFRPSTEWTLQVSSGHLVDPEQLHPGNITRTTASAAWSRLGRGGLQSFTFGVGANALDEGTRVAGFGEYTREIHATTLSTRVDVTDVEAGLWLGESSAAAASGDAIATVGAWTLGALQSLFRARWIAGALGANVTFYAVPDVLRATHGDHPVSFRVFVQIRPNAGAMGRMWNMRMGG